MRVTKADVRDLEAALRALDRLADRVADWDSDEWDEIASARSLIREWPGWVDAEVERSAT